MQIEVYKMTAEDDALTITLEAICDTFSSLLWDIEYYKCGSFEVYITANPQNVDIFQPGCIVGRDDDNQHFGIIESVQINTDVENGDYLTVKGRFLMCLLERRIIHPTYNVTAEKAYSEIVREVVTQNTLLNDSRKIPGLSLGTVSGTCWEQTTTLQIQEKERFSKEKYTPHLCAFPLCKTQQMSTPPSTFLIALGWSTDKPCISHMYCSRVRLRTSCSLRGQLNLF